jgi:hypothetical protein
MRFAHNSACQEKEFLESLNVFQLSAMGSHQ